MPLTKFKNSAVSYDHPRGHWVETTNRNEYRQKPGILCQLNGCHWVYKIHKVVLAVQLLYEIIVHLQYLLHTVIKVVNVFLSKA